VTSFSSISSDIENEITFTYVLVIGTWLLPIILAFIFPVPDMIQVIVLFASLIGLIIYIVKNFVILMMMDILLASLSCFRTARTLYHLPINRTVEAIRSSILSYGVQCEPSAIKPTPSALQYKFSNPLTIYNSGSGISTAPAQAFQIDHSKVSVPGIPYPLYSYLPGLHLHRESQPSAI